MSTENSHELTDIFKAFEVRSKANTYSRRWKSFNLVSGQFEIIKSPHRKVSELHTKILISNCTKFYVSRKIFNLPKVAFESALFLCLSPEL